MSDVAQDPMFSQPQEPGDGFTLRSRRARPYWSVKGVLLLLAAALPHLALGVGALFLTGKLQVPEAWRRRVGAAAGEAPSVPARPTGNDRHRGGSPPVLAPRPPERPDPATPAGPSGSQASARRSADMGAPPATTGPVAARHGEDAGGAVEEEFAFRDGPAAEPEADRGAGPRSDVAARPATDRGPDPVREELDRRVLAYQNEASRIKTAARRALESSLASARKRNDPASAERAEQGLRDLGEHGRISNDLVTIAQLKNLRREEALMQVVYERAEIRYKEDHDDAGAARVRREREAFLEKLCSSQDDRFLRERKLSRKGRYYVLHDAERAVFDRFDDAQRHYKRLQAVVVVAATIKEADVEYERAYRNLIDVRALIAQLNLQIASGLKGAPLRAVQAQLQEADMMRIEIRRQYDQAFVSLASPPRRQEARDELLRKLAEHRDNLAALQPAMKEVSGDYRVVGTPEVREALERLGLDLGPSAEYRDIIRTVGRAAKELKSMNIDLRPGPYQSRPKL